MLRFLFTDIHDDVIDVKKPVFLTLNIEEFVPADSMTAVFEYFFCDELKEVRVFDDSKVIFTGVVDEQIRVVDSESSYIKVVCRSMAAKLLDNESVPISYTHPSASVIERQHISPVNLSAVRKSDDTLFGTLTVLKGETNYQAVENFSKAVYKSSPRINEHGQVEFISNIKDTLVTFSNDGSGISYKSLKENIKRCEEISKVRIKVTNSSGYHSVIENKDALKRGIMRERYLNAVQTDTPAKYADNMIRNSKEKAYTITLECIGQHLDTFLCKAKVSKLMKKDVDNLYVSAVRYQLSGDSEVTIITLRRKEV